MRRLGLAVWCWIAFCLGILTLGARYLWGDEAFSVFASRQPLRVLLSGFDAQPPLYYVALGFARLLWGESEFALRFLSLGCAVLWVAMGTRLALEMLGLRASYLAGLLLATAPLALYLAQEARMYAPAALFSAALAWATWRLAQKPSGWGGWLIYAGCALGGLFTHYYTAGVLMASAAALGVYAWRHRMLGRWIVAHGVIALIFGAWFVTLQSAYLARASVGNARQLTATVAQIMANASQGGKGLLLGPLADEALGSAAVALQVFTAVGWVVWARRATAAALLVAGWIAATLGLVLLTASPSAIVPDFHPRYLLFALLPTILVLSSWVMWLPPRALLVMMAVWLALARGSNWRLLFDANWQKSRYAALMQTLRASYQAGDVVVMLNSDQVPLADYYKPPALPIQIVPNDALDSEATRASLQRFLDGASRVWVVRFGWGMSIALNASPLSLVSQRGLPISKQGFQDADLLLFDLRVPEGEGQVRPLDVRFGRHIRLIGVRERRSAWRPGDSLTLDLIWQADGVPEADYTVFMHLRRADSGEQIAAFDHPPSRPTSTWSPGEVFTDTRAVRIPPDAPGGRYRVVIGWYAYPSFERLIRPDGEGTEFVVSEVEVR